MKTPLVILKKAIRIYCMAVCSRERCSGCVFEEHSERKRQVGVFLAKRERVAAERRKTCADVCRCGGRRI